MAKWAARIVGSLCLLGFAVVAGLAGWTQTIAKRDPQLVLEFHPGEATALLSLAEKERLVDKSPPARIADIGNALLRRAPLLDAPLVYNGLKQSAAGDAAGARTSFTLAVKRQPRNVAALSWLAVDAVQTNQLEVAAAYLDRLSAVNPQENDLYAETLASIASREGAFDVLTRRLESGSLLAEAALDRLNAGSSDMPLLLRLNAHSSKGQARLIGRLFIEQGAVPAFVGWLSLASEHQARSVSWPVDPAFVGDPTPLPFNWELLDGAELLTQGGLYISYSGRESTSFAQQVMILTPGRYLFRAEMDGEASATGGKFEWAIECLSGQQQTLGRLTVPNLDGALSSHDLKFEVPGEEACPAQRLALRGRPGEFPARTRATVRRVLIQAAEASE